MERATQIAVQKVEKKANEVDNDWTKGRGQVGGRILLGASCAQGAPTKWIPP